MAGPQDPPYETLNGSRWVLVGGGDMTDQIAAEARRRGADVVTSVEKTADPLRSATGPCHVVHLEQVTEDTGTTEAGFHRLVALTQALSGIQSDVRLTRRHAQPAGQRRRTATA